MYEGGARRMAETYEGGVPRRMADALGGCVWWK
jgi:hypothetical protein